MPRRGGIAKREVIADPIYKSKVVTKLINQIMLDGKRGTAQRICYDAFGIIEEKTGKDPMEVFEAARRRRDLPGAHRSSPRKKTNTRHSLACDVCRQAQRAHDEGAHFR